MPLSSLSALLVAIWLVWPAPVAGQGEFPDVCAERGNNLIQNCEYNDQMNVWGTFVEAGNGPAFSVERDTPAPPPDTPVPPADTPVVWREDQVPIDSGDSSEDSCVCGQWSVIGDGVHFWTFFWPDGADEPWLVDPVGPGGDFTSECLANRSPCDQYAIICGPVFDPEGAASSGYPERSLLAAFSAGLCPKVK
jgi:hypothetical protein